MSDGMKILVVVIGTLLLFGIVIMGARALWGTKPASPDLPPTTAATEEPTPTPLPTVAAGNKEEPEASEAITQTNEAGDWRVATRQDLSFAPELGFNPGFGVAEDEIGQVVGVELHVQTPEGTEVLDGGCQQLVILPGTYCRDCGGIDWGFKGWWVNEEVTSLEDEIAILTWEQALQQIDREECPLVDPEDVLDHVMVVQQAEGSDTLVELTPWTEFRRPSGVDNVTVFVPGDRVIAWHIGMDDGLANGLDEANLCDGGNCYLEEAPVGGWFGGGVVNGWKEEFPVDAESITIPEDWIDSWMENQWDWDPFWVD